MSAAGDPDRLVLAQVATRARLLGSAVDQLAVDRRLDAVAREGLPAALGEALARALPQEQGIVRIDTVAIDFAIDRRALDGGELASRWAARLGAAIAGRIRRGGGGPDRGIARFPSYAAFVAAYLEHRFAVALHPAFAFADFAALEHLAPADAALELIAARPAYLAEVARQGRQRGRATWLADRLREPHAALLIERVLAAEPPIATLRVDAAVSEDHPAGMRSITAPTPAAFRAMLAQAPVGWRQAGDWRGALLLALTTLAELDEPDAEAVRTALALARLTVLFDRLRRETPGLLARLVPGSADPLDLLAEARAEWPRLTALLADPPWQAIVRTIAAALSPPAAGGHAQDDATDAATRQRRDIPQPLTLSTPFAGTALLLPILRQLRLAERLHSDQLRALLIAAIDPAQRDEDAADALATFLVPHRDPEPVPPWPPLPDGEPRSAAAWAIRLLSDFAERLPGLQESTPAYLRRQFLHHRGDLTLDERTLTARIARPPLAIVLTMSGMIGDQGALPWLAERRLRIDLA